MPWGLGTSPFLPGTEVGQGLSWPIPEPLFYIKVPLELSSLLSLHPPPTPTSTHPTGLSSPPLRASADPSHSPPASSWSPCLMFYQPMKSLILPWNTFSKLPWFLAHLSFHSCCFVFLPQWLFLLNLSFLPEFQMLESPQDSVLGCLSPHLYSLSSDFIISMALHVIYIFMT